MPQAEQLPTWFGNSIARHYSRQVIIKDVTKLSDAEYRSIPAVSASDMRQLSLNPREWAMRKMMHLDGSLPPWLEDNESDAMRFGTAVHMAALEPERYNTTAEVLPYFASMATKEAKEAKREAELRVGPDGLVLKAQEGWGIKHILKALHTFGILEKLRCGKVEYPVVGTHKTVPIKGKIDAWHRDNDSLVIYDIKTTSNFDDFVYSMRRYNYGVQAVHYAELLNAKLLNTDEVKFYFVVVESSLPFRVQIIEQESKLISITHWIQAFEQLQKILAIKTEQEFNEFCWGAVNA